MLRKWRYGILATVVAGCFYVYCTSDLQNYRFWTQLPLKAESAALPVLAYSGRSHDLVCVRLHSDSLDDCYVIDIPENKIYSQQGSSFLGSLAILRHVEQGYTDIDARSPKYGWDPKLAINKAGSITSIQFVGRIGPVSLRY